MKTKQANIISKTKKKNPENKKTSLSAYRGFGRLNLEKNVLEALITGSTFQVSMAIQWKIQTCAIQPFLCAVFISIRSGSRPTFHFPLFLPSVYTVSG